MTRRPLAHARDEHAGEASGFAYGEPESTSTILFMPDAEYDHAVVGMPGGAQTDPSIVDEVLPGRQSVHLRHLPSVHLPDFVRPSLTLIVSAASRLARPELVNRD